MRQPDEQSTAPGAERTDGSAASRSGGRWEDRWDGLVLAVCALLPAGLAAVRVVNAGDAAHDEAIVRAAGLGWTGAWRALDGPWGALASWIPLGTHVARLAFASAVTCGVASSLLFMITRGLLRRVGALDTLGTVVAGIASLAATLSPPWQTEAAAPAGSCLGALLALAPGAVALASSSPFRSAKEAEGDGSRWPLLALLCGLAVSYEPLVGLAALAAAAVAGRPSARAQAPRSAAWFVVGLAPLAVGLARRVSPLGAVVPLLASPFGERGESGPGAPMPFALNEVGSLSCIAVVAGVVLAWRSPTSRASATALTAIVAVSVLAMVLGAPAGPSRYAASVLAGVAAAYALAAVALHALVRVVDQARIPFARASATMILLLEAALPARAADDASVRADQRAPGATAAWNDVALGPLPAGTALLLGDPRVHTHLLAARAAGDLRADLAVVPFFDLAGPAALHELARDPKLQPLWHDATLVGPPQEASLSSIASYRPITLPYDPAWDRALARHLVPVGLFARFEPEPRGASDRRRGLDDFMAVRDELARTLSSAGDRELQAITVTLLRARLVGLAAAGERDVIARGIDDLRPFAPRDPLSAEIVRRLSTTHGVLDVKDLPR